jgi:hypothetical protein
MIIIIPWRFDGDDGYSGIYLIAQLSPHHIESTIQKEEKRKDLRTLKKKETNEKKKYIEKGKHKRRKRPSNVCNK